jgi:hypothetical protein
VLQEPEKDGITTAMPEMRIPVQVDDSPAQTKRVTGVCACDSG